MDGSGHHGNGEVRVHPEFGASVCKPSTRYARIPPDPPSEEGGKCVCPLLKKGGSYVCPLDERNCSNGSKARRVTNARAATTAFQVPIRCADPIGAVGSYWSREHTGSRDDIR
jgi:hypothetical protein